MVKLSLSKPIRGQRGRRIIGPFILKLGTRRRCGLHHALATLPLGKNASTHCAGG